jgi:outer membrane receptor protein involved in Fe transport
MRRRHVGIEGVLRSVRIVACTLALVPVSAIAQSGSVITGGVLTGTVVDASTRAPVPNVVVTATSPGLQGEQVVLTDETGTYRVPQLPSGTYTLRFEREGYKPLAKEGIDLPAGYTLRFNPELFPEVAGATTVSVVGENPLVDVGSTQQGAVVEREFIQNIPLNPPNMIGANNRSFENVALSVPGVHADLYGVGIKGATSPENAYLIDGMSTRQAYFGVRGSPLSVEFVDSVSVLTGGYLPEYGRATGGIIAANTRSGGNEFHGSIWGTWTPGALAGSAHAVEASQSAVSFRSQPHNIVDFGLSLGGYLIKDRLWFFVGVQPEFSRYRIYRELTPFRINSDGSLYTDTNGRPQLEPPIYTDSHFADEHQIQYIGKLTYLINEDHRLSLTVTGTPSSSGSANSYSFSSLNPGQVGSPVGRPSAIFVPFVDNTFDVVGKLSSSFAGKRVLLDVIGGWHHEDNDFRAADGSKLGSTGPAALANQPRVNWGVLAGGRPQRSLTEFETLPPSVVADCLSDGNGGRTRCATTYFTGGPAFLSNNRFDTFQGRVISTFLFQAFGHHVVKLGFDGEVSTYDDTFGYSGGALFRELGAGGPLRAQGLTGYLTGPDQEVDVPVVSYRTRTAILAGFVQDSWSVLDRVTLNVGVRYESQTVYGAGDLVALSFPNEWSPRVGVIWDLTQQGRSKLYASYARYYENIPLFISDNAFGSAVFLQARYAPASGDCNPASATTVSCGSKSNLTPGTWVPPNTSWHMTVPNIHDTVDPESRPPSVDEWAAGFQYELFPHTRASLAYTHRNIVSWVEDMTVTQSNYFIGNPGFGIGSSFPQARRVYNSIVVAVDKVYANGWLAQLSYTYQNLTGNIEGLFQTEIGQLAPNLTESFDILKLAANHEGPLPGDIRHTIKAYAAKEFVLAPWFTVTTGAAYVGSSGAPISWLGANNVNGYGDGAVYIFPRGSGGRLPWQHTIDVNGALNFRFSSATILTLSVNVFNLFNFQTATAVDQNYTHYPQGVSPVPNGNPATDRAKIVDDVTGLPLQPSQINPQFLQPTAYQPVRQVRFQARLSF